MVSKKRLDYGFSGHRAIVVPKAPRSIRRRRSYKNPIEDSKLCAFELLAAVADKLLQESESSASSNIAEGKESPAVHLDGNEKPKLIDDDPSKSNRASCDEGSFVLESSIPDSNVLPQVETGSVLEQTSVHSSSNIVKEVDSDGPGNNTLCKIVSPNHVSSDSIHSKVESGPETHSGDGEIQTGNLHKSSVQCPVDEFVNNSKIINPYGSVQLPPLYRDRISRAFIQKQRNNVKIGISDDDENLFGCNKLSTKIWPFKPQPRIGHRRIRNTLTSKYRKVAPKLKGYELYNTREKMRSFYRYRKRIYTGERFQQGCNKKRKLSERNFAAAHNQETSCDSFSNLPEKVQGLDKSESPSLFEKGHQKTRDNHVKFSIKSFKVPELYVEVPENASVGSLKRTVMEAVAAILGSGIRVGVVVQGKKIRDDNRTLKQEGISQSSNLDALGFTLEPKFAEFSPSTTPKKLAPSLPCDTSQELPRTPATPLKNSGISNTSTDPCLVKKFDSSLENSGSMSTPQTPENELPYASASECKMIVPVPPTTVDPLTAVPLNSKPKRAELSQRRTRRPFSVSEVEALVGAVEKLGTGRWRDVKIGAFENADHRTYVDLKDKWKTLVHTASISPQQRRGEPVPQELLNRVLAAHSYWSQQQAKQLNGEGNLNVKCNMEGVGVKTMTTGSEDEA